MDDITSLIRRAMWLAVMLLTWLLVGCTMQVPAGSEPLLLVFGPTLTPQSTYTPQPTYTAQPTDAPQPTYTRQATYTPQPTHTPRPPYTPRPSDTPLGSSARTSTADARRVSATPTRFGALPAQTSTPVVTSGPTPTFTLSAACQNPQAQFTQPSPNAQITGVVPIVGTANIPDFSLYKVQYVPERSYPDGPWGELYQNKTPVVNGTLMTWTTRTVDPGVYWLRLMVHQRDGNYPPPCELRLIVVR